MSQIDILIYFPLLIWFIFYFLIFYSFIFWLIVPLLYFILKIRFNYFFCIQSSSLHIQNIKTILVYLFYIK